MKSFYTPNGIQCSICWEKMEGGGKIDEVEVVQCPLNNINKTFMCFIAATF